MKYLKRIFSAVFAGMLVGTSLNVFSMKHMGFSLGYKEDVFNSVKENYICLAKSMPENNSEFVDKLNDKIVKEYSKKKNAPFLRIFDIPYDFVAQKYVENTLGGYAGDHRTYPVYFSQLFSSVFVENHVVQIFISGDAPRTVVVYRHDMAWYVCDFAVGDIKAKRFKMKLKDYFENIYLQQKSGKEVCVFIGAKNVSHVFSALPRPFSEVIGSTGWKELDESIKNYEKSCRILKMM